MKKFSSRAIILAGFIAEPAALEYAAANERSLRERFPSDIVDTVLAYSDGKQGVPEFKTGECACIPLEGDGICEGLWKLSVELECGLDVDLKAVPVRQETIEVCEIADIDPYNSDSSGAFLLVPEDLPETIGALAEKGLSYAVIGRTLKGPAKRLRIDERIRCLDKPASFKGSNKCL